MRSFEDIEARRTGGGNEKESRRTRPSILKGVDAVASFPEVGADVSEERKEGLGPRVREQMRDRLGIELPDGSRSGVKASLPVTTMNPY